MSPLPLLVRHYRVIWNRIQVRYTGTMGNPIQRLRSPRPGGAIAAARDFGVDLTLLIERLQRTPEQRLRDLQKIMQNLEAVRGATSLSNDQSGEGDPPTGRE